MSNSDNLNRMLAEAVAAEIRKDAFWLEYNLKIDTLIKSGRSGLQDGSKVLAAAYTGGGSVVVAEIVAQGIDAFMEEMLDVHLSPDFYSILPATQPPKSTGSTPLSTRSTPLPMPKLPKYTRPKRPPE